MRIQPKKRREVAGHLPAPQIWGFIRPCFNTRRRTMEAMTSPLPSGFYAEWRRQVQAGCAFRESPDPPPERWLQQVWRHQRLRREALVTLDGRAVRVLHPGFWNREPGPDFRDAVVQLGESPAVRGDIELDVEVRHWQGHRHSSNPAYRDVVLQVVWDSVASDQGPPVLPLKPYLDAPLDELIPWLDQEAGTQLPPETLGRCCAPLRQTELGTVTSLLLEAAQTRLTCKAANFLARARQVGWDQALWEGLFQALGYKHNGWPLRRVAEVVAAEPPEEVRLWEARLMGVAGLIPIHPPETPAGIRFVRELWESWWRERDRWLDQCLPPAVWRLAGVRPANHPQRRLALAARWRSTGDLPSRLQEWLTTEFPNRRGLLRGFHRCLQPAPEPDGFWTHHWTFRSAAHLRPLPFLGITRTTDLAINVVLPWLHARTRVADRPDWVHRVEERYLAWPPGQDNARLRHARVRLFAGEPPELPRTAAIQQGLLQIVQDFCIPAGPLCGDCPFPGLVTELKSGS